MNRGYVKLWRKTVDSHLFSHEGLLKLFILCLLKATHRETEITIPGILQPIKLKPAQFITGRYSLWEEYHQLHLKKRKPARKPLPSAYSLIRWLLTLQEMQMLSIKTCNKYSIITVLNWELYQENEQQASNKRASSEHKQEQYKHNKENPDLFSEISELRKRYPDQDLINRIFQAIASTRKSGKVSGSVLFGQLEKWNRYPIKQVEGGMRIYLDKGYVAQGKDEKYLLGIIRNQDPAKQTHGKPDYPKFLSFEDIEAINDAG